MTTQSRRRSALPLVAASVILGFAAQTGTALAAPAPQTSQRAATSPAGAQTVFGSTVQLLPLEQWDAGIAREESSLGRLGVVRVFQNAPAPSIFGALGDRSGIVSFHLAPAAVLSGQYDAQFTAFFAAAPLDHTTWWSYYHEADVAYMHGLLPDLAQFRAAYTHIGQLARNAGNPQLKNAVILVGYTANPKSGLQVADFMPRNDLVDVVAWDNYNGWFTRQGTYGDPSQMVAFDQQAAAGVGKPFGVAEFGSTVMGTDTAGRATWITGFSKAASAAGAKFVSYYDSDQYGQGAEYRLLDPASLAAYRAVLATGSSSLPDVPGNVVVTAGEDAAQVTWQAAGSVGTALTGYTVTATNTVTGSPVVQQLPATATSTVLSGLTDGQSYAVTVTAANGAGTGSPSAAQSVVPGSVLSVPAAPTVTGATGSNGAAAVSWTAPVVNGGSSVSSYTVTATDPTGATAGTVTVAGGGSSAQIGGLTNGTPYVLSVTAVNAMGAGPAAPSSPVTPWTAPGAPTLLGVNGGNASVTATWAPPASNGGAAITGYTVSALDLRGRLLSATTVAGTALSGTVPGLVNGKPYLVTVTALNGQAGPASARSTQVVPMTVASTPVAHGYGGNPSDSVVSATAWWFTPTSNGGSPITGYRITTYQYDGSTLVGTQVSPMQPNTAHLLQVTGLVAKATYRFTVTAYNAAGASVPSALTELVTAR